MVNHEPGQANTQTAAATGELEAISVGKTFRHAVQVQRTVGAGAFAVSIKGSLVSAAGPWDTIQTINTNLDITQFTGVYRYLIADVTTLTGGDQLAVTYVGF